MKQIHHKMPLIVAGISGIASFLLVLFFLGTVTQPITGGFLGVIQQNTFALFAIIILLLLCICVAATTCYFNGCKI